MLFFLRTSLLVLISLALLATSALSQETDHPKTALEEILVTATRRIENLQDVPLSLNVVSGDLLARSQENELSRLSKFVPSLRFIDAGNDVSRSVSIRGVGTNTFSRGVEQSVGTSVDGVVSGSLATSLLDFGDVQRIEVLHGPQGMLFGKNASAGLINIVTRDPAEELGAGVKASWADGDEIKYSGFLTGPIVDGVAGRVSFFRTTLDPYIENLAGQDVSDRDEWGLRAKLRGQVGDNLAVMLSYAHAERSPSCCGVPAVEIVPGGIADAAGVPTGRQNDKISNSATSTNDVELDTYIFEANWDLGDYVLSSLTSYSDSTVEADVRLLFPHESAGLLDPNLAQSEVDVFTQELRIASGTEGFLEWIGGLYYYDKQDEFSLERNTDLFYVGSAPVPDLFGSSLLNSSTSRNTSYAAFGTLTFNWTERVRMNTGLRWNYDDVSARQVVSFDPTAFPTTIPEALSGTQDVSEDDQAISWRISGEFDVLDAVMTYASIGQGYKGPGTNTLSSGPRAIEQVVDAEIPTSYEIGLKSLWWDDRLRLNGALFYTEFEDFQTTQTRLNPTTQTLDFFLANAGKLETKGVELDLALQATDRLSLSLVAAYIDSIYDDYQGAQCYGGQTEAQGCIQVSPGVKSQDLSGTELWNSPDWSFTLGGQYGFRVTDQVSGYAMGSYAWVDDIQSSATGNPRSNVDSYGSVDVAIGITANSGRYSAQIFAKNLLDEFYETSGGPIDVVGIERNHTLAYTYKRRIGIALSLRL
jgi:iron complex outermembrane receptor protein